MFGIIIIFSVKLQFWTLKPPKETLKPLNTNDNLLLLVVKSLINSKKSALSYCPVSKASKPLE